jgi:hypothetical protein
MLLFPSKLSRPRLDAGSAAFLGLISREKYAIFTLRMARPKDPQSVDSAIERRLKTHPEGWVFTPTVFRDLGSEKAVEMALARHLKRGQIRRLGRGVYDLPRTHPRLGALSPAVDAVAEAIKGRDAIRLQASGAYAAHLLGLTDQVPMRIVYLTDGPTRQIALGGREIRLKRTTPRGMATAGRISGTVFQALRWLGKEHVDDAVVRKLRERLSERDKQTLMEDIRYVPAWVAEVFRAVVQAGE